MVFVTLDHSRNMAFIALAATLVGSLTIARHFAEPSCPGCSAKAWSDNLARLECCNCGWTNIVTVAPTTTDAAHQYEIVLADPR